MFAVQLPSTPSERCAPCGQLLHPVVERKCVEGVGHVNLEHDNALITVHTRAHCMPHHLVTAADTDVEGGECSVHRVRVSERAPEPHLSNVDAQIHPGRPGVYSMMRQLSSSESQVWRASLNSRLINCTSFSARYPP